ncbi:MAG TPA: hypothetical protein VH796_07770 [Nitrososphaeraceae archaeon]
MSETNPYHETIEVLYGNENIQRIVLEHYPQIKEQHDACMDRTEVATTVSYEAIWNGLLSVKKRGIRLRCKVEATLEESS